MFKLPIGVDINNLIDDLRLFSWEASDILLHYSKRLKNQEYSKEIIKLNHEAFDRALYSEGAITAAKWLINKKPGLYSMRNLLNFK